MEIHWNYSFLREYFVYTASKKKDLILKWNEFSFFDFFFFLVRAAVLMYLPISQMPRCRTPENLLSESNKNYIIEKLKPFSF